MKLRRPEPKPEQETIVALIDVVFFLLVFFILIGRMDATAPFDLIPPHGVTGQALPAGGFTVAVAPDGGLAIDGVVMDREAVLGAVRDTLAAAPQTVVRINADGDAALRHVLPLISDFEAAGAQDVVLIVSPEAPS